MKEDKYELIGEPIFEIYEGQKIPTYKIRALKTFKNPAGVEIKRGEIGGRISLGALSQNGNCWIDEDSVVVSASEDKIVFDDAYVCASQIYGNVNIRDNAIVSYSELKNTRDYAMEIKDEAKVVSSKILGNAKIAHKAQIGGSKIRGQVIVDGQSLLENCKVANQSLDEEKFLTIRLFGDTLGEYSLHDRDIIDTDIIVNNPQKQKKVNNKSIL